MHRVTRHPNMYEEYPVAVCGRLHENDSLCLNSWSPVGETVWEGFRGNDGGGMLLGVGCELSKDPCHSQVAITSSCMQIKI